MPHATTTSAWVQMILQGADNLGLDTYALCLQADIALDQLDSPMARIPQQHITALWQAIRQQYTHSDLPVRVGSGIRFEHAPVINFAMLSSPTLGDALKRLLRFQRLIAEAVELPFYQNQHTASIGFIAREQVPRLSIETAMVAMVAIARRLTSTNVTPAQVCFTFPTPTSLSSWQSFFHCPLHFSQTENRIDFNRQLLAHPIASANPQHADRQDQIASQALQQLKKSQAPQHVRYWIEQALLVGEPKREWVAKGLGISVSTLQRRLKEHGLDFQHLLEEIRKQQAQELLTQQIPLREIALRLGYQEQSNFQRAFKRWFGTTPKCFYSEN